MAAIPKYAEDADPTRLVRIVGRGKCGSPRLTEMEQAFPDEVVLRRAQVFDHAARCLRCGYQAKDTYNWHRD
jgi:hypothetical protein